MRIVHERDVVARMRGTQDRIADAITAEVERRVQELLAENRARMNGTALPPKES